MGGTAGKQWLERACNLLHNVHPPIGNPTTLVSAAMTTIFMAFFTQNQKGKMETCAYLTSNTQTFTQFLKLWIWLSFLYWQPVIYSLVATIFGCPLWSNCMQAFGTSLESQILISYILETPRRVFVSRGVASCSCSLLQLQTFIPPTFADDCLLYFQFFFRIQSTSTQQTGMPVLPCHVVLPLVQHRFQIFTEFINSYLLYYSICTIALSGAYFAPWQTVPLYFVRTSLPPKLLCHSYFVWTSLPPSTIGPACSSNVSSQVLPHAKHAQIPGSPQAGNPPLSCHVLSGAFYQISSVCLLLAGFTPALSLSWYRAANNSECN